MYLGLELALTGMGTVFTFLVLLIFVTSFMSRIIHRIEKSADSGSQSTAQKPLRPVKSTQPSQMSPELLTTIVTAAIHKHRSKNRD